MGLEADDGPTRNQSAAGAFGLARETRLGVSTGTVNAREILQLALIHGRRAIVSRIW
jgi:hypothetical protein